MPFDRVAHQTAVRIVKRDGPVARLRRHSAHHDIAAAVERLALVVVACLERDAVTGADRQYARARDHGARIRIDARRAMARPCVPGADAESAEGLTLREREPRRAEADHGRDNQRKQERAKKTSHAILLQAHL